MDRVYVDSHVLYSTNGLLPDASSIKLIEPCSRARYLTPLEHSLLFGLDEEEYLRLKGKLKVCSLLHQGTPVFLWTEIFKQLFVSPLSTISTTINVPSELLGKELKSNLLRLIKEKYQHKCTRLYGYVTEVVCIKDIYEAYISKADCSNEVLLTYVIRSMKPRLNNLYEGIVKACYTTGILASIKLFAEHHFYCNVLVLADTFNKKTKSNSFVKCPCEFARDQPIFFQITDLDYDMTSNTYACVGTHICR